MLGSRVPMLFLNDPPKMVHRSTLEDWEDLSVCETIEDNNTTEET